MLPTRLLQDIQNGNREALREGLKTARRNNNRQLEIDLTTPLYEDLFYHPEWSKDKEPGPWYGHLPNPQNWFLRDILKVLYRNGKIEEDIHWVGLQDGSEQMSWDDFYAYMDKWEDFEPPYEDAGSAHNPLTKLVIVGQNWWIDYIPQYKRGYMPYFHQMPSLGHEPKSLESALAYTKKREAWHLAKRTEHDQMTQEEREEDQKLNRQDHEAWLKKWGYDKDEPYTG